MEPIIVQLDRERELKFTFKSFAELGRKCKINANEKETYSLPLRPDIISSFIWAGQLHEKDPLTLAQVESLLPMTFESDGELMLGICQAVLEARGVKPKPESANP
jgi:hypothetical protein